MKITHILLALSLITVLTTGTTFAKQDKEQQLPPGLQKKAERGQELPPGWQKKLATGEIMDKEIYRHSEIVVPVDKKGLLTVRIEGKLVKLYEATREIVEVLN